MEYERITAADVQVGDWICAARTHPARKVERLSRGAKSVWITLGPNLNRIRPNFDTKFWRVTDWSVD